MFRKTYVNTIKNLFRSPIFWIILVLTLLNTFISSKLGFLVGDNSEDFTVSYFLYLKLIPNALSLWTMSYGIPLFAVISTMLAVNGDYKNGFYEIEKAGGVSPLTYFTGRLCAIISVNFIVLTITSYFAVYSYCITRGLDEFTVNEFIADSVIRIFRLIVTCELPILLFYIGLSFMVTAILKNGRLGVIVGSIYVIVMYALRTNLAYVMGANTFSKYFWTFKINAYQYMNFYDTEYIHPMLYGYMTEPVREITTWILVFVSFSLVCYITCYICTRKRQI